MRISWRAAAMPTTSARLLLCLSLAISFTAAAACASNLDCSLNGVCTSGRCRCDSGWVGKACTIIDLLPARRGADGYRAADGSTSWGGNVVRSDDGSWHMIAAELVNFCAMGASCGFGPSTSRILLPAARKK